MLGITSNGNMQTDALAVMWKWNQLSSTQWRVKWSHVLIIHVSIKNGIKRGVRRITNASKARPLLEDEAERGITSRSTKALQCKHAAVIEHPENQKTSMSKSVNNSQNVSPD